MFSFFVVFNLQVLVMRIVNDFYDVTCKVLVSVFLFRLMSHTVSLYQCGK